MSGSNRRVNFSCLGISKCKENTILNGIISADLSLSININQKIGQGTTKTIVSYSDPPSVDFSYTEYLKSFIPISSEYGLNDFVGFKMAIGLDTDGITSYGGLFSGASAYLSGVTGSSPYVAAGVSFANLRSVVYSFPLNDFFSVTRTYTGYSKTSPKPPTSFVESTANPSIRKREHFTGSVPSNLSQNALQSVEVSYTINRTPVPEFATRKPYASYINFPIETTVTYELLTQKLDSYVIDAMQTACKNNSRIQEDLAISVCDCGSLSIKKAYLTNLRYNGGGADSRDNQTISVTYSSYEPIDGIKPVSIAPDQDPCA